MRQAAYITRSLVGGQSKVQMPTASAGDIQLVDMWIRFLKHNGLMEELVNERPVSAKVQAWRRKVDVDGNK